MCEVLVSQMQLWWVKQVSPIEYGHVLLVPKIVDQIPQQIDTDSLELALNMAVEARNPFFRLGYNSLGAFATINHLHFQVWFAGCVLFCGCSSLSAIS